VAGHFACIGHRAGSQEELRRMLLEALDRATSEPCGDGVARLVWEDDAGGAAYVRCQARR